MAHAADVTQRRMQRLFYTYISCVRCVCCVGLLIFCTHCVRSIECKLGLYPVCKHQADIMQTYSVYTCTTCALIASRLLDICFIV